MKKPVTMQPDGEGIYKIQIDETTREGKVFLDLVHLLAETEEGITIISEEEKAKK